MCRKMCMIVASSPHPKKEHCGYVRYSLEPAVHLPNNSVSRMDV